MTLENKKQNKLLKTNYFKIGMILSLTAVISFLIWDQNESFAAIIFTDDFSGSDAWDDAHASTGVNIVTNQIEYTFYDTAQNEAVVYDLGVPVSDTEWTLRFSFNITSSTQSNSNGFFVGLNDSPETTASSITQDGINIVIADASSVVEGYAVYDWNNQIPNQIGRDAEDYTDAFSLNTKYYAELSRTSATTYDAQVFTDSGYSIPFGDLISGTVSPTTDGLQYIKILNFDSEDAESLIGNIDDVVLSDLSTTTCNGLTSTIPGATSSDDIIIGTSGDDVIIGLEGNDIIYGMGGNDTICGNEGNDFVRGGTGDDFIRGDGGKDVLLGDEGNDTIRGNAGNDRLVGGSGEDTIKGGAGDDVLVGGTEDDDLDGGAGNDFCDMSDPTDTTTNCENTI